MYQLIMEKPTLETLKMPISNKISISVGLNENTYWPSRWEMWKAEIRRSLVKNQFFTNNCIFTAGKCHVINFSNGYFRNFQWSAAEVRILTFHEHGS